MKALLCATVFALVLAWPDAVAQTPPSSEDVQWDIPSDDPDEDVGELHESPPPGLDPSQIVYFEGKPMECKNLLGGDMKCCREPVPDQQKEWWERYKNATRQGNARRLSCLADPVAGAHAQYREGADYRTLQSATTSERENLDGGGQSIECQPGQGLDAMQDEFMAYENSQVAPNLGWYCDQEEFELAVQRNVGQCSYVGTRCVSSTLGYCLVEKEVYCCFNSPVSREIRESQLASGERFGTASEPRCEGLSAAEVSQLDLDRVAIENVEVRMAQGEFLEQPTEAELETKLTGGASAMGNSGRKTLSERTQARMSAIEYGASQDSIEDSERVTLPTEEAGAPVGPGRVTFTAPELVAGCDRWLALGVNRDGGQGTVSALAWLPMGQVGQGVAYEQPWQEELLWGDGETGIKTYRVKILKPAEPYIVWAFLYNVEGAEALPYSGVKITIGPCP